jgi:5-formyltetrahydrofolate cyclo-ligase
MSDQTVTAKAELRRAAVARRDALPAATRAAAAEAIGTRPFPLAIAPGTIVSGFMPMKNEFDPLPLMRKLAGQGARLALPVILGRGKPLIMRAFAFGEPLVTGVWGIREPPQQARALDPDIVLVPLIAFDRAGNRLGFGGGYYDLTLTQLRSRKTITAVGLTFAALEVPKVPATERDARLDLVLTEREVIDARGT